MPTCDVPYCAVCCFSKPTMISVDTLTMSQNEKERDSLKRENVYLGSIVSTDQCLSSTCGCLVTTGEKEREWREKESDRECGCV